MRVLHITALGAALVSQAAARHSHKHGALHSLPRRHSHHVVSPIDGFIGLERPASPLESPVEENLPPFPSVKKRNTCAFPTEEGLVAVTPGSMNGGWALPPDQACEPGHYCPYACPPGEMMAQWDPEATSYSYPASLNGGLYCNDDGEIEKPFGEKPYCAKGAGGIGVTDKTGEGCAFCQTVLPGSESMLIPTFVQDWAEITVPDTDYWCSTAAHYYVNPPGVSASDGCVWGTPDKMHGNWSPYVAGTNKDSTGNIFLKIGWNPKYIDGSAQFPIEVPSWGLEIECDNGGCNGLPCKIDPNVHQVNEVEGDGSAGAGGAGFCVVTVPEGSSANIVVFNADGSSSHASSSAPPEPSTSAAPSPSPVPVVVSSSASSSFASPSISSSSSSTSSSSYVISSTSSEQPLFSPHIFRENITSAYVVASASSTISLTTSNDITPPSATSPIEGPGNTNAAGKTQIQAAGLAFGAIAAVAAVIL